MAPYRPNRKTRRSKKYKKIMSEAQESKADISLQDVAAAVRIIDVASERGTFKGAELSSVGQIRDRFQAFVDFHAPKEDESKDEATTEGAEATEETSE